jgi:hypothetical protein
MSDIISTDFDPKFVLAPQLNGKELCFRLLGLTCVLFLVSSPYEMTGALLTERLVFLNVFRFLYTAMV